MSEIVALFEARCRERRALQRTWSRVLSLTAEDGEPSSPAIHAVAANALALIHFDDASDVAALGELARAIGVDVLASTQEHTLASVDRRETRPLSTALVLRLAREAWPNGQPHPRDPDRSTCAQVLAQLIFANTDGHPLTSEDRGSRAVSSASIALPEWRRMAHRLVTDPWTGPLTPPFPDVDVASRGTWPSGSSPP